MRSQGVVLCNSLEWTEWLDNPWLSFGSAAKEVPELSKVARTNGRAIADAWVTGPGRPNRLLSPAEYGDRSLGGPLPMM